MPLDHDAPMTGNVGIGLASITKEMVLVVVVVGAVGTDKEQTIARLLFVVHDGDAARNGCIQTAGLLLHPTQDLWSMLYGTLCHKPCGKHFGQDVEVSSWLLVEQVGNELERPL